MKKNQTRTKTAISTKSSRRKEQSKASIRRWQNADIVNA